MDSAQNLVSGQSTPNQTAPAAQAGVVPMPVINPGQVSPLTPPSPMSQPLPTMPLPQIPPQPLIKTETPFPASPPPPPGTEKLPPQEEPGFAPKEKTSRKGKVLMTAGPLMMVLSLATSFYIFKNAPARQVASGPVVQQTYQQYLQELPTDTFTPVLVNSPTNPDKVTVKCEDTQEELQSGVPTTCSRPVFTWEGERANELETNIVGYYIYLGDKSDDSLLTLQATTEDFKRVIMPETEGIYTEEKSFVPENLEKGKTYYFAVQAVSDTKNLNRRVGFSQVDLEQVGAQIAKVLFVLQYE